MLSTHASVEESYISKKFAAPIAKPYFCSNTCCPDYANTMLDRQSNWLSLSALLPSLLNTFAIITTAAKWGESDCSLPLGPFFWLCSYIAFCVNRNWKQIKHSNNQINHKGSRITSSIFIWEFPFLHGILWPHMRLVLVYISNTVRNKA